MKKTSCVAVAALVLVTAAPAAFAINGMYLTGYGTESTLMGGADVAVANDAFAANNNPAGMMQLQGQSASMQLATEYDIDLHHDDPWNKDKPRSDHYAALGNFAYARHNASDPWAAGVALVVQGGLGWTYSGLNVNPLLGGGRDDTASMFAVVKLAPALAWQVNDALSIGAAVGFNYFAGNQELFPNTSNAAFQGFRFKEASGIGVNSKLGLQYKATDDVTVGLTYGTKTSIPMKGGNLRLNLSNMGLGVVRYDDARLDGFRLPEEWAIGVSFHPTPRLLMSLQEKWYGWSKALNTLSIVASNPRTAVPAAQSTYSLSVPVGFRDQDVLAIGLAYDYSEQTTLMAGYNHCHQVIPSRNVSPLFAPIPARHLMLGASHKFDAEWQMAGGMEFYLPQTATYDSPIFGSGASDRNFSTIVHLSVSRGW